MKRSLILFFLMVLVSSISYGYDEDTPGKWWKHPKIARELGLSNDQVNQIEGIFSSYKARMMELNSNLKQKEAQLRNAITNPNSSREEILRMTAEVEGIKGNMRNTKIDMFLQVRDVLTPEQRSRLEDIRTRYGRPPYQPNR